MNFLRKFDTYLLEHHPILWHSKVVYMLLGGGISWALFFVVGYLVVDLEFLRTGYLYDYFFESYMGVYQAILAIIVLSFWALAFYKKNAIRHYYPLKRLYFTRLFVCILLSIWPLMNLQLPFTWGMQAKARSLVELGQLYEDAKTSNLAMAFLPEVEDEYKLENRSYPKPFPLGSFACDVNSEGWNNDEHYYIDAAGKTVHYNPAKFPENTTTINNTKYQFFRRERIANDSCDTYESYWLMHEFYHPDSSLNIHFYSILNYSTVCFPGTNVPKENYLPVWDPYGWRYSDGPENENVEEYISCYAPTVYRWVNGDKKDSIAWAIGQFEKVMDRYGVEHALRKDLIAEYLSVNEYWGFDHYLIGKNMPDEVARMKKHVNKLRSIREIAPHIVAYDQGSLERIYTNTATAYGPAYTLEILLALLGLSIGLAMLFLLFDFTNLVQFLIALPVAGVLTIITALLSVLLTIASGFGYNNEEVFPVILAFSMATLVIGLSIAAVLLKRFGKRFAGVLLNIGFLVSPLYPFGFVGLMVVLTKQTVYNSCHPYGHTIFNDFWIGLLNPAVLFPLALVSVCCYTALIKRWYAKAE